MSLQSLGHVLNSLENQEKWRSRQQFKRILGVWPQIVGAAVSSQTQPVAMRQQTLQVATSSAAWAQNLAFERRRILTKLNAQLALNLTDIRFSTAQWRSTQFRGKRSIGDEQQIELWQQHPSHLPKNKVISRRNETIDNPKAAFARWAAVIQARSKQQPLCRSCHCPTPAGEIQRWSVCALCATKQW
ncbi:MAG: DUF721 domain-containing protein [Cyanothece sp. SIO1E1]|nr:DUF721 domain-containing protein [Cyanothece sp. SIO1E1]